MLEATPHKRGRSSGMTPRWLVFLMTVTIGPACVLDADTRQTPPGSPAGASDAAAGWRPMAFVTEEARDAGVRIGGEGAQWPQSIDVDEVDGSFVLFATDVGGIWRSLDGGERWEPCNVGYTPRGSCGIAIDPHFPDRVISVGSNSMGSKFNGLYLSEDRAASWRPVRLEPISGREDRRRQVVFDPTTRDEAAGLTRVAYWSRTAEVQQDNWGDLEINPGLYRSDDGGRTWKRLNDEASRIAGHSALAVHPASGRLYAANERGVFISDDRGESFERVLDRPVTSIAVSKARPESVWITHAGGLRVSDDAGLHWREIETTGLEEPIAGESGRDAQATPRTNVEFGALRVNPVDADRMVMRSLADDWRWLRHVSDDGGRTWATAQVDPGRAFFPQNARQAMFSWHPTDVGRVWSFGGDWPTLSTDGGRTYRWAGDGQNAVFVAGLFNLNPHHPGLLFLSSQDYNGGVTHDGGRTWRYTNVSSNGWGGFTYGGTALSPHVLAAGHAAGGWSAPRVLTISRDGGATWTGDHALTWTSDRQTETFGFDVGLVHPIDEKAAYVARFRTTDGGQTWRAMEGCSGVFAADASGRLFGVRQRADNADLVISEDLGETWRVICSVKGGIDDLSVTPDGGTVYLCSRNRLWSVDTESDRAATLGNPLRLIDTPPTSTGWTRIATVSVDPQRPNVIYVGQRIDLHVADKGVMRSDDGGEIWTNLNLDQPIDDQSGQRDGGREPQCVRVDPHTGALWVTTGCYGVWQFSSE